VSVFDEGFQPFRLRRVRLQVGTREALGTRDGSADVVPSDPTAPRDIPRLTRGCNRRPEASAALPLPGAAEPQRSVAPKHRRKTGCLLLESRAPCQYNVVRRDHRFLGEDQ
jgi:hypothetical protein